MKQSTQALIFWTLLNPLAIADSPDVAVTVLPNAHAHNDYEHPRPLLDALEHGFTSVEADVFLVEGQLLVAHNLFQVSSERTLEKLYLQPLSELAERNGGRVYENSPPLTLLVDIKTNGAATYAVLEELLAKYDSLISVTTDGKFSARAVTVIISGDRPLQEIEASEPQRAGIDGRLADLSSDQPADLLPLISDNWTKHFRYRGAGTMSDAERKKLSDLVTEAHAKGRRVRFWGTPESPELWQELRAAGVDLIGTDDLAKLRSFLQSDELSNEGSK
jgi:Glycerophosphoryl diester phosphodiesterase family